MPVALRRYIVAAELKLREWRHRVVMETMLRLAGVLRRRLNKKPIWVIAERPHEARDNGYHFFSTSVSTTQKS